MPHSQLNGRGHIVPTKNMMVPTYPSGVMREEEPTLPQGDPIRVILRRVWMIVLAAPVFAGMTVAYSLSQTPSYQASTTVLVGQNQRAGEPAVAGDLGNELQGLQSLSETVAAAVGTRPIAEGVVQRLGLRTDPSSLQAGLDAGVIPETTFVRISYTDTDPERARRIANAVGEVLAQRIAEVSPSANDVSVTVWERALVPGAPVSPDPLRNGLLGLVLGLMIGVGLAFLLDYLDDDWRSPEEVERVSKVPAFAVIPEYRRKDVDRDRFLSRGHARGERDADALITVLDPAGAASEAFRTLRTSLLYAQVDAPPKVIVVTSPGSGEGKSTICANLGVVLAQAGKNVLVVDCDFRRARMRKIFGLGDARGISDVLAGEHSPQGAYQEPIPDLSLKVLCGDTLPANPTELLGSRSLWAFLAEAREEFDFVLIDSPPTGMVSDPMILGTQGDGVLLVIDAQNTPKGGVQRAVYSLAAVGANVLGTVMNNAKPGKNGCC